MLHGSTRRFRPSFLRMLLLFCGAVAGDIGHAAGSRGYFYVGGHYEQDRMVGQMFVQYDTPEKPTHRVPIIMIHGTDQTGTNFIETPDGRPGWMAYFATKGYPVFVVDQAGRARSGQFPDAYGKYARFDTKTDEKLFTAPEKYRLWPQAVLHTQWPSGPGVVGNPAFDQFMSSQAESLVDNVATEALNEQALLALLERVGPAVLLTHSQSGVFGWKIGNDRPDLVRAIVAVEPNGPPFYDPSFVGGSDWYKYGAKVERPWGITRLPLTFEPLATDPAQIGREEQSKPEGQEMVKCWLQTNPPRRLPSLAKIPIIIVTAEASFRATYDHCTSEFLEQAGVHNTHLRLAEKGIHGNEHMMMLEKNSDDIARVIADWIGNTVKAH